MPRFFSDIRNHANESNRLHRNLHDNFARRHRSDAAYKEWREATARYREFSFAIDKLIDGVLHESASQDDMREFIFDWMMIDPIFNRSGYIQEKFFRIIKRLDLDDTEKDILKRLLIKRVKRRSYRNFRLLCRLIPKIADPNFLDEIRLLAKSQDTSIAHRATFAVQYFPGLAPK